MELGLIKDKKHIYSYLKDLRQRKLIARKVFGVHLARGRLEDVYFLLIKGERFLLEKLGYEEQIHRPKRNVHFINDYFHRMACVSFQVHFYKWLIAQKKDLGLYENYYFQKPVQVKLGN